MNRIILAALVLSSSAVFLPTVEAQTGFLCGFASITDSTVEGDVQIGEIDGGPLFAADVENPGEETANISIRCTIQVGAQGATHAGVDSYTAVSDETPAVAELAPHLFAYVAPEGAPVYLCTEATVAGQKRYWDSDNDPADTTDGGWQLANGHDCSLAIGQEVDPGPALLPADAVVIVAPVGGSEPIHFVSEPLHFNAAGWDCSTYTWSPVIRVYDVSCTSTGAACSTVAVVSIGTLGTVIGETFCSGGNGATAVSPGVAVGSGGASSWRCIGVFLGPGGSVDCDVVT